MDDAVDVMMKNGYAFVEFSDSRDADDAVHDLNGRYLEGRRIIVDIAKGVPRNNNKNWLRETGGRSASGGGDYRGGGGRGRSPRGRSPPPFRGRDRGGDRRSPKAQQRTDFRLIVENLSSRVSWQDLKDEFRSVGEVTYTSAHDKRMSEGLVEFAKKEDMKLALERMNGKELNGKKIKLREEKPSRKSQSRSPSSRSGSSRSRSPVDRKSSSDGKADKRKSESKPAKKSEKKRKRSPSPDSHSDGGGDKDTSRGDEKNATKDSPGERDAKK